MLKCQMGKCFSGGAAVFRMGHPFFKELIYSWQKMSQLYFLLKIYPKKGIGGLLF
jgi:hypothetical protein